MRHVIATMFTLLGCILLLTGASYAKQLEFIREYSYAAGEADSKISCRAIALEQVKRLLLEELGTYLVSNTVIKDSQFSKDEIITYTAGAVVTVIIEERWDGQTYFLKAKIKADDDDVAKSIKAIMQNQENIIALEKLRKEKTAALKEIERLNKDLAVSGKNNAAKGQDTTHVSNLRKVYDQTIAELTAKEFLEQGIALRNTHKYDLAVEAYSRAQKTAPLWPRPYIGRGITLLKMNKTEKTKQALEDFDRALQLDPTNAIALSYHGVTLVHLGKKQKGFAEIEQGLDWLPNDPSTIANMGWGLLQIKQPDKALTFLTKSLELQKVKSGRTYYLRSLAYRQIGEQEKAKTDLDTAALLGDPTALKSLNR
jgi:Flp pilus assembly protein TadD